MALIQPLQVIGQAVRRQGETSALPQIPWDVATDPARLGRWIERNLLGVDVSLGAGTVRSTNRAGGGVSRMAVRVTPRGGVASPPPPNAGGTLMATDFGALEAVTQLGTEYLKARYGGRTIIQPVSTGGQSGTLRTPSQRTLEVLRSDPTVTQAMPAGYPIGGVMGGIALGLEALEALVAWWEENPAAEAPPAFKGYRFDPTTKKWTKKRHRRRRILTQADRDDISYIVGMYGKSSEAARNFITNLSARRR